ncbi:MULTISPECIES: hypothetical protein [Streptococcus]|jgi:hypothetical protein|uniref:Uncharacterized protein n=1 Tax=Streptococcus sanguinis TaxID=1305 RepID=A0A2X3XLF1_STRSA|nr:MULTISPECIES: hypothetical protein [Streptococcus]EGJ41827.1 PE family protein [Streptococcus sanguinis SK1059]EGQ18437.1 PE family protein [Streptococcus sanguinis ATCC 29667]EGQ25890.1 PE family protein [Streptococcus sanguinis SK340]MCY7015535.1 PE family protein [Streptococcus sanguinis]WNU94728.1 PE family protein [Streptococcus sp. DTU_2020_1000888_1_SI_GRL_NUU_041A]
MSERNIDGNAIWNAHVQFVQVPGTEGEEFSWIEDDSKASIQAADAQLVAASSKLSNVVESLSAYLDEVARKFVEADDALAQSIGTLEVLSLQEYDKRQAEERVKKADKYISEAKTPEEKYRRQKNTQIVQQQLEQLP